MEVEERIDNTYEKIMGVIGEIEVKLDKRNKEKVFKEKPITEKKNHALHILIEKNLIERLRKESKEQSVSLGEYCRRKLRDNNQLNRIEDKLDNLIKS